MSDDPELIDIRADEQLDLTRLEPYLRAHLPKAEGELEVRQFGGGHANLTYLLRFDRVSYVLRRPPLGPVAPSSHDMAREHRVLAALSKVYKLAPVSHLLCEDPDIIGAPFHVMERRYGFVIRNELPKACLGDVKLCRRIGWMIVDALAALHRTDPAAAGLGDLGHPEGFAERQMKGWSGRWEAAKHTDLPRMQEVIDWLSRNVPEAQTAALLHNDYKLDNMLVSKVDPATAVAVLDWDMCTRGDPLMDLGYLLNFWGESGDDPAWLDAASMPTWQPGFPKRSEVIARYAEATGLDLSHIHWCHAFGIFKIAVVLQQIYIRYLRGQTQDQRFAVFGDRVAALVGKAVAIIAKGPAP